MTERHTKPYVPHEGGTATEEPDQSRPTADWTKAQLQGWLHLRGISYATNATKPELQTLAGIN